MSTPTHDRANPMMPSRFHLLSRTLRRKVFLNWQLYLLVLIPVTWILIFRYIPMYGAQIAFKRFNPNLGIWSSPWIGFSNFIRFLSSYNFGDILRNTIVLNVYELAAGFPIPIMLAILIHYCPAPRFKRTVQMVTYAPHFISTVVMVGIIFKLFAVRNGIVNAGLDAIGLDPVNFLGSPGAFPHLYVWTGVWQSMGWGTIIYLAALSGVDPELHNSAKADGANIWQRIWYIDLPGIMPTLVILLILKSGQLLDIGFEKVLLMQNSLNIRTSEVISTYVYKIGLASTNANFSYAAAIGLFKAIVSFILLVAVNRIARRINETSLW
jgi:multiple sugar transport system permease protein/putative aldouronate transport system permease protein